MKCLHKIHVTIQIKKAENKRSRIILGDAMQSLQYY